MECILLLWSALVVGEPVGEAPDPLPTTSSSSFLPGFLSLGRRDAPAPTQERPSADLIALLSEPAWVRCSAARQEPSVIHCPWRHPAVEELLDRCRSDEPMKHEVLTSVRRLSNQGSRTQRFNAALLLVQLSDDRGLPTLSERLLDPHATPAERILAAHALAVFPNRLDPKAMERLLESCFAGQGSLSPGQDAFAGDVADLVVSIAWLWARCQLCQPGYDASTDRWIDRFAKTPMPELRRIAALAHSNRPWTKIPRSLAGLLEDSDPSVRGSALAALTQMPETPARADVLKRTYDVDIDVMALAVERLAAFPDLQTTMRLSELRAHPSPLIRQAVVRAGARLRQESLVLPAIEDPSAEVRIQGALALRSLPSNVADPAWRQLVQNDRSSEVQLAAVTAVGEIPLERGVPILLVALGSPAAKTRQAARNHLVQTLPEAEAFPLDGPPELRSAQVEALTDAWRKQARASAPGKESLQWSESELSRLQIEELVRICLEGSGAVKSRASERLRSLPVTSRSIVEDFFLARDQLPSVEFVHEVLAVLDPAYVTIARTLTREADSAAMRNELIAHFERRATSQLQAILIARHILADNSMVSWTSLAPLLLRDHSHRETATGGVQAGDRTLEFAMDKLVDRGLTHPNDIVRGLICHHLDPINAQRHHHRLELLMADSSERVRMAAIRAFGSVPDARASDALRADLESRSIPVQIQAAAQLCRRGDPEGQAGLERLFAAADPDVRKSVLACAPALAQGENRKPMLRLLTCGLSDDSSEVRIQALAGLEQAVGYTSSRPPSPLIPREELIAQWKTTMAGLLVDKDKEAAALETLRDIQKARPSTGLAPIAN